MKKITLSEYNSISEAYRGGMDYRALGYTRLGGNA